VTDAHAMTKAAAMTDDLVDAPPQEWLDSRWRFRMKLPRAWRGSPGSTLPPKANQLSLLARYERTDPPAKLEIFAAPLEREVDTSDWLAQCYMLAGKTVDAVGETTRSAKRAHVEASWNSDEGIHGGRFCAIKQGSRMYLLICSTTAQHRSQLAALSATPTDTFAAERAPDEPFSEDMRTHRATTPIGWELPLPTSWIVEQGSSSDDAASFQAENIRHDRDDPEETVGKMAFAVLARSAGKTARDVAELYLSAVRENGLDIGTENVTVEAAQKPFTQSWYLVASVACADLPGELRCRVMRHDDVCVLAGMLGLTRDNDLKAWMENKRALDVATFGLRLKP